MNQNSINEKENMIGIIRTINKVEGFDPVPFSLDITDKETGEQHKHLPVRIQLAWFWLKYPQGKIDVRVVPENDSFVADARVYPDYKAEEHCYIARGSASRTTSEEKPSISPREWAQTAAIGVALRNAGFGLQFDIVGEMPDGMSQIEGEGYTQQTGYSMVQTVPVQQVPQISMPQSQVQQYEAYSPAVQMQPELTQEQRLQQALNMPCPVSKFAGKTLGEVMLIDPGAIKWTATKFSGNAEISAAAKFICECSLEAAA